MRRDFQFGGLSNSLSESVEADSTAWAAVNCTTNDGKIQGLRRYYRLGARSGSSANDVAYGLGYARHSGNTRYKMVLSGDRTGGTFTISYNGGVASAAIPRACTATEVYEALTGMTEFNPDDVVVTGGSFPGFPITIDLIGQYAGTDGGTFTADATGLTGGTTGAVTFTKIIPGGINEAFYAVVKHSGNSDANLYMVTSSDGFVANTTWTSLASNLNASDWYFQQYFDKMFMANTLDGLFYVFVGSGNAIGTPPKAPTQAPVTTEQKTSSTTMINGSTSWAQSGFSNVPTITAGSTFVTLALTGTETNRDITLTGTISSVDWKFRDKGWFLFATSSTVQLDTGTATIEITNADGSPATIIPDFLSSASATVSGRKQFHFADESRTLRDNIVKVVLKFRIVSGASGGGILIYANLGDSWPNDTRAMTLTDPPFATKDKIEYAYSYYDASTGLESSLSPVKESPTVTTSDETGSYVHLLGVGSTELNTTDDRVFFYRREKSTNKWRRLPTIPDWNGLEDFGATNVTASYPEMDDHWMEHELADFPEPDTIGFPPVTAGETADGLFAWKQSLGVISGKQIYFSGVGKPLVFAPSPDDTDAPPADDEDPLRPVTEYVPDDRSEPVMVALGLDPAIAFTDLAAYGKVGDSPSDASVFRRLPGSRGTISRRGATKLGGGATMLSQDGMWYYSISRGFSGEDNGSLIEREETKTVRQSYKRLLSDLHYLVIDATEGDFYLTVSGVNTDPIAYNADRIDILDALESISTVNRGDVEVFGADGEFYIRTVGQYAGTDGPTVSATSIDLAGAGGSVSLTTLTTGGGSGANLVEFQDEYWAFNSRSYLFQSRNEKWHEGVFSDPVKIALATRTRGLFFITDSGELMKIADGYTTDGGAHSSGAGPIGDTVEWEYETPWMTGERVRITGLEADVTGNPTFTVYTKDGAAGVKRFSMELPETPTKRVNCSTMPGHKHKIVLRGIAGRDEINKLTLFTEPLSGANGT